MLSENTMTVPIAYVPCQIQKHLKKKCRNMEVCWASCFVHHKSLMNVKGNTNPPKPGMFLSRSHGNALHHLPRDVFPRDPYHTMHQMSSEDSSEESGDVGCDIMYGDEDAQHRPLGMYSNLEDLDELEDEAVAHELVESKSDQVKKKKGKKSNLKKGTSWNKMKLFSKHKESEEERKGKTKKAKVRMEDDNDDHARSSRKLNIKSQTMQPNQHETVPLKDSDDDF
eukprot:172200_1